MLCWCVFCKIYLTSLSDILHLIKQISLIFEHQFLLSLFSAGSQSWWYFSLCTIYLLVDELNFLGILSMGILWCFCSFCIYVLCFIFNCVSWIGTTNPSVDLRLKFLVKINYLLLAQYKLVTGIKNKTFHPSVLCSMFIFYHI